MSEPFTPPSIVVGIDGSPDAVHAALWAVPEAVSREVPLRLVSVAGSPSDPHAGQMLKAAADAVGTTGQQVRIEAVVLAGAAAPALLEAARDAAMVCVGALGITHADRNRIGSTAAALVSSAHCPVAVVRGSGVVTHGEPGWVAVELDETRDDAAVLQFGVQEARLRGAPLRVLGAWQSRSTDLHDDNAISEGNRLVRAQLDRRLSEWKQRYPDLDVQPVPVHGSMLTYLERNARNIQLVVVGAGNTVGVDDLLGPPGLTALHGTACSVLVVDRQRLL